MKITAFLAVTAIVCCSATMINKTKTIENQTTKAVEKVANKPKRTCDGTITIINESTTVDVLEMRLAGNDNNGTAFDLGFDGDTTSPAIPHGTSIQTAVSGGIWTLNTNSFFSTATSGRGSVDFDDATGTPVGGITYFGAAVFHHFSFDFGANQCAGITIRIFPAAN